jgi:hypothetical protein
MKRTKRTSRTKLATDLQKIAVLAPYVATRRIGRMLSEGAAGKSPAGALTRLSVEKASVAAASTTAMMFAAGAAFTESAFAIASAWSPWGGTMRQRLMRIGTAMGAAQTSILTKGIAPIHRRVASNSRPRAR